MGDNRDFQMDAEIDDILIYRTKAPQSLVQTEARLLAPPDWSPDRITIVVETNRSTSILVKEAYFPEWVVHTNASSAQLVKDKDGFMEIWITPVTGSEVYEVSLVYERPYAGYLSLISALAFLSLATIYVASTWRMKRWHSKDSKE
jgi:hypothetical protein